MPNHHKKPPMCVNLNNCMALEPPLMYQKKSPFELRKTAYITRQGNPRHNE